MIEQEAAMSGVSKADRLLIKEVAALNQTVTPSQLKRWRARSLLPKPQRTPRGRRGITSDHYPPGTAEIAAAIADLMSQKFRLSEVAVLLFLRGFDVHPQALQSAVSFIAAELRQWTTVTGASPGDEADALAQRMLRRAKRGPLGRTLIARAGTYGARRNSSLEDALVALATLFRAGDVPSAEGTDAVAQIFGSDHANEFQANLLNTSLDALINGLADLTYDEWSEARELHQHLSAWTQALNIDNDLRQALGQREKLPVGEAITVETDILGLLSAAGQLRANPELLAQIMNLENALEDSNLHHPAES